MGKYNLLYWFDVAEERALAIVNLNEIIVELQTHVDTLRNTHNLLYNEFESYKRKHAGAAELIAVVKAAIETGEPQW